MIQSARRLFSSLCAAAAVAAGIAAAATPVQAQIPYTSLSASEPKYAAIVVDANSGEILYGNRQDAQRYPASLTKIMTMYLVFEALSSGQLSLNERLTVSPRAAAQAPTKLGLRAGETIAVSDALQAVAIKSANDMSVVLAEKIAGTESRFAALMTLRARELGMNNTRFVNSNGLPDSRQLTTARDLAILSRAVMRDYPQYYSYFSQKKFTYHGQSMNNHNRLLFSMPGVDGIKTGFTNASGYNLAASATRNNRRVIAVVLGGNSSAARDGNVQHLLETGFDVFRRRQQGEVITIAQNMFESAPTGPAMRPSIAQGDTDVQVSTRPVSDKPQLRGTEKSKPVKLAVADDKAKKDKSAKSGSYLVQVGAFRKKALAQTELKRMKGKFSKHFGDADQRVESTNSGEYRARFAGLTASEAKAACSSLKSAGQVCMIVSPR